MVISSYIEQQFIEARGSDMRAEAERRHLAAQAGQEHGSRVVRRHRRQRTPRRRHTHPAARGA